MAQHPETDTFQIARDPVLEDRILLLMMQAGDLWWNAGSAVLIADRVALSATHIVDGFYRRNRDRIEAALGHMPLQDGDVIPLRNISFVRCKSPVMARLFYVGASPTGVRLLMNPTCVF